MPFGPYDKFNPRMKRYREEGIKFVVSRVTAEAIARKAKRDLLDLGGQTAIAYVQSLMATQVAERQKRIVHTVADGQAD
jgi:CobQ-like glutamine amidotransferase family enzyme